MNGTLVGAINENKVPELAEYHLSPVKFRQSFRGRWHEALRLDHQTAGFRRFEKISGARQRVWRAQVQNVRNAWDGKDFLWLEMMAEKGYIIFTLDNRGSYGRGHAFETPSITISEKSNWTISSPV